MSRLRCTRFNLTPGCRRAKRPQRKTAQSGDSRPPRRALRSHPHLQRPRSSHGRFRRAGFSAPARFAPRTDCGPLSCRAHRRARLRCRHAKLERITRNPGSWVVNPGFVVCVSPSGRSLVSLSLAAPVRRSRASNLLKSARPMSSRSKRGICFSSVFNEIKHAKTICFQHGYRPRLSWPLVGRRPM